MTMYNGRRSVGGASVLWLCGLMAGTAIHVGCAARAHPGERPASADAPRPVAAKPVEEPPPPSAPAQPAPPAAQPPPPATQPAPVAAPGPTTTRASDEARRALAEEIRARVRAKAASAQTKPAASQPAEPVAGARPRQPSSTPPPVTSRATPTTAPVPPSPAASASGDRSPGPVTAAPGPVPPGPSAMETPASGTPHMELDPKDFNFGEVWQNAPAEREFTVKNTGAAPLTLSAKSSCGCTVATQPRSPLGPGETTTFKITYSTVAAGAAHKTVTLTTNDPAQPTAVINVQGSVKAFITATPSERIFFQNLETNSKESQTIRLESKYDSPVHLQVREGQSFGIFEVALKEIEPGRVFELTATTKPPLPPNNSAATVILETGLEKLPTYNVFLNANVPPRVLVTPPSLSVPATTTQPMEQMVRVQHRLGSPLSITDIKASLESIRWEILPEVEPSAGLKVAMIPIRLKLPVWDDLPIGGATVEIYTDDPEPQFQKLEVRIFKPPRPPLPATRPAISPSVRPPTTRPVPASRPVPLPPQPAAPTSRPT